MTADTNFWSRRRAEVAAEERRQADAIEASRLAGDHAALADRPEDEVLADLGLPCPEDVVSGDDIGAFMAKAVPEYLRRRALRALWRSNPVLACLDGLNDYDGDFTNAATDAPGVKTSYQVGKGLKAHLDHLAEQAARAEAEPAPDAEVEIEIPTGSVAIADASDTNPAADDPVEIEAADMAPVLDAEPAEDLAAPRRMAFSFDGGADA